MDRENLNFITEKVIGCAFKVSNTLGAGFLEKVYQNAMMIELSQSGLQPVKEKAIIITYKDEIVGQYYADILVNNKIIVEIKAVSELSNIHQAQLLNYLKATHLHLGLLINFGNSKVQIKRMVNGE